MAALLFLLLNTLTPHNTLAGFGMLKTTSQLLRVFEASLNDGLGSSTSVGRAQVGALDLVFGKPQNQYESQLLPCHIEYV